MIMVSASKEAGDQRLFYSVSHRKQAVGLRARDLEPGILRLDHSSAFY